MSTPDFTGSGRSRRHAPLRGGRAGADRAPGDVDGGDAERYGVGRGPAGQDGYGRGGHDRPAGGYGEAYGARDGYGRAAGYEGEQGRARRDDYGRASRAGDGRASSAVQEDYRRGDGYGGGDGYRRPPGHRQAGGSGRGHGSAREQGYPPPDDFWPGGDREDDHGGRGMPAGGGGNGRPPRRRGDWWRRWTWKKALAVLLAACGVMVVAVAILIGVAYASTPIPTDVSQMALQQASTVYFSNGTTSVGTFGTVDRQLLAFNQIPAQFRNAVLAAEDRNFYHEGGISPTGILRAAFDDIRGSDDALQGGSTITQQFVRNYYANIGTQQTIGRKLKEIFVSIKLARQKSKDWILTQYLNTIYFGDGAYGVEAAAKTFFGKPVGVLDVAQDAMIASMLNAPGQFDPTPGSPGYPTLVARWQYVLQGMVAMHALTPQQAAAQKFPKVVGDHQQSSGWTGYNGYIMQAVENELENTYHYTVPEIDNDGLKIVTTFSQPLMKALYATVAQEERQMADAGPGAALPWYAHVGAVLEQPGTGAIVAMYSGPSYSEPTRKCQRYDCQLDMALANREQVGSSFKPYVLAAARAQGMSVKTSVLDGTSPLCVPADQYPAQFSVPATGGTCPGTPYGWHMFTNDEGDGASGPVSVVTATAQSLNTAYTDLTHRVGTQNVINMARSFGVNTAPYPEGSSLQADVGQVGIALGQNALTVEEQANTFATLANNGEYNTPHVIRSITQGTNLIPSRVSHHEVLTPAEASDVDYALSFTTTEGTGTNAEMTDGRPMIGKTGTTSTAQSAFFLGAIPQYSLTIGIFTNNQNASTAAGAQTLNSLGGLGGYGGDWPALIWHAFAEKEFAQLPIEQFPAPGFGGTTWNLVGQQIAPVKKSPGARHPGWPRPSPRPSPSCAPGLPGSGCTSPSPTPTPTPTPTRTCIPGRHHHCQPFQPEIQGSAAAGGTQAADRARRLHRGGSG